MHPFFKIEAEQIQRLDDTQARHLIAKLCEADVSRAGLAPCVFYGGDQRASDGGVDVDVAGRPVVSMAERLSRSVAAVQVKADAKPFSAKRIANEMAPKGKLRAAIAALAEEQGLYVIAATKENPSFSARKARVDAMRVVLARHGVDDIAADFYGAQEIASWVESHPNVAIWLRQVLGQPLSGWQAYSPWAYRETDVNGEFTLDEIPRVLVPGRTDMVSVAEAMNAIRSDLRAGQSVRLVGLSGLGKTRLAQALFDDRVNIDEPALSPVSVLYADIGDRLNPAPQEMIEALPAGAQTIMIVDNCGQETHNALVERKKKGVASVGLLTIEYDIQDGIAPSTRAYRLEGASEDTMETILRARFPRLSAMDRDVITRASEGNARLAIAIAETAEQSGQLSLLEDGELFRRLFHQKAHTDNNLLRCARAASLLYSFDGESAGAESELAVLAELAEVSIETFQWHMVDIERRGLLQARGKMRAILPHAVSNYLAREALQEIKPERSMSALFSQASSRVRASFAHRLSYLPTSKLAVDIVSRWLNPGGALSRLSQLDNEMMLVFKRIAPMRPALTLAVIEQFLDELGPDASLPYELRDLVGIAKAIAYDPPLFESAVRVLIRMSGIDQHSRDGGSGSEGGVAPLFQIIYSGTQASMQQRSAMLRELLSSGDERVWRIGLECLEASLKTQSLSISREYRFGSRSRDYGKAPQSMQEQQDWFSDFLSVARHFVQVGGQKGELARAVLGRRIRDLLVMDEGTVAALIELVPVLQTEDGWPEAWTATKLLLKRSNLDPESRARILSFKKVVAPTGLRQRVSAKLQSRELFDDEDSDVDGYERREKQAARESKQIGAELGRNEDLLRKMMPQIMDRGVRGNTYYLGQGVAASQPDVLTVLMDARSWLATVDASSASPLFLCGLLSAWVKSRPDDVSMFLDGAVSDPVWARWFPDLQRSVDLDSAATKRILKAIDLGIAPIQEFSWLGSNRSLMLLPMSDFIRIIDRMAATGPVGVRVALDNLHMHVYSAKELDDPGRSQLGAYCLKFLLTYRWGDLDTDHGTIDHELDQVVRFAVKYAAGFSPLESLMDTCIELLKGKRRYDSRRRGGLVAAIIRRFPEDSLNYLESHRGLENVNEVASLILAGVPEDPGPMLQVISSDALLAWTAQAPEARAVLSIQICRLGAAMEGTGDESDTESTMLREIYNMAPNKSAVIEALGQRLLPRSFSSNDVSRMSEGIHMIDSLPDCDSKENQIRQRVRDELVSRISIMSDLRPMRTSEPEGFE